MKKELTHMNEKNLSIMNEDENDDLTSYDPTPTQSAHETEMALINSSPRFNHLRKTIDRLTGSEYFLYLYKLNLIRIYEEREPSMDERGEILDYIIAKRSEPLWL